MPLKTTIIQHVYEFNFRIILDNEAKAHELAERAQSCLRDNDPIFISAVVDGRELCMEESYRGGERCLMTEGHRGKHEGPTGNRWGDDL